VNPRLACVEQALEIAVALECRHDLLLLREWVGDDPPRRRRGVRILPRRSDCSNPADVDPRSNMIP
jgi:hypothetical protein